MGFGSFLKKSITAPAALGKKVGLGAAKLGGKVSKAAAKPITRNLGRGGR